MLNQIKIFKVKDMNHIFVGHYGSGKTEVSINFALNLKKENPDKDIAIIDLDIVNPYYRTADAKEDLKRRAFMWKYLCLQTPTWTCLPSPQPWAP